MLDFKNILVPYDGSEQSRRALATAVSVAGCCENPKIYVATISNSATPLEISVIANSNSERVKKTNPPAKLI